MPTARRADGQGSVRRLENEEIAGNRIALDVDCAAVDRTRAIARGPIGSHGLIHHLGEVDAEDIGGRLTERRRHIHRREGGRSRHEPDLEALNGPVGHLEPGDLPPTIGLPPRAFETGVDFRASQARLVERLLCGTDGHGEQGLGLGRRRCHRLGGQSDAGDDRKHDDASQRPETDPEMGTRPPMPQRPDCDPVGRVLLRRRRSDPDG